jgi:hypothetical protein
MPSRAHDDGPGANELLDAIAAQERDEASISASVPAASTITEPSVMSTRPAR